MSVRILRSPLHEGADGGGRGVEHRDAEVLHDLPEPVALGPIRRSLVHDDRGPGRQRPVDHVRVPGHPADVRGAPEDVGVAKIEDPLGRGQNAGHVAARGVDDALGPARGPGGVQCIEHVLGVHALRLAVGLSVLHDAMPPVIAALPDAQREVAALDDEDVFDRGGLEERVVGVVLQWDDASASVPAVGRNQGLRLHVVDPLCQGRRAESTEHDGVNGADASTGEHGDGQFGNHRHVDRHPIAALDPPSLQGIGEAVHLAAQVPVGQRPADPIPALSPTARTSRAAGPILTSMPPDRQRPVHRLGCRARQQLP